MYDYKHYYRPDENGIVILGFSDADMLPDETDFLIGEGARQFTQRIFNDRFQYIFKIVGDVVVERSQAELDAELEAQPPVEPSIESRLQAAEEALTALLGI